MTLMCSDCSMEFQTDAGLLRHICANVHPAKVMTGATMSTELTEADREAIERIYNSFDMTRAETLEAIARHFIGVGMERAAVICDEREKMHARDNDESQQFEAGMCAKRIRAAKGQP